MKPALLLPLAIVLSTAAAYLVCSMTLDRPAPQAASASTDTELARLTGDVHAIQQSSAELGRKLDALESALASRPSGETRVPMADIEAAVARALAAQGGAAPAAVAAAPTPPVKAKRSAKQALADLEAAGSWDERTKLWKTLREEGVFDEVFALYEKRATDNPGDANAQVEYGTACLQKLFTVTDGPEKGVWATKADKAFDNALAIDDHNWGARFTKAVSLSNWPAFMGKQASAARQFETLIEQQKSGPVSPEHAQTYFYLGNMYQSMGKSEQALATWRQGLEIFPGNTQLQGQISSADQH